MADHEHPIDYNQIDMIQTAKNLVAGEVSANWPATDPHVDYKIYVVWFAFTLGNFKALLSTSIPDGKYYEITADKVKNQIYVDTYVKINNTVTDYLPEEMLHG